MEGAMGVWGTGIFQDDTACDIRDEYKDHLGNGLTGPEATTRILTGYASLPADPDESGVEWLALAAAQWQHGRLEPETLERALAVIDSGSDLRRWVEGSKDFAARRVVLQKLRAKITSPQPVAKKVRRPALAACDWRVGELIAFKLLSAKLMIFRVIGHHSDRGGKYPVCELLDWTGDEAPALDALEQLEIRRSQPDHKPTVTKLMIVGMNKKSAARMNPLGIQLKPAQKHERASVVHWKYLDKFLKERFSLE